MTEQLDLFEWRARKFIDAYLESAADHFRKWVPMSSVRHHFDGSDADFHECFVLAADSGWGISWALNEADILEDAWRHNLVRPWVRVDGYSKSRRSWTQHHRRPEEPVFRVPWPEFGGS